MADIDPLLTRWQSAGVLDAEAAARIRAHKSEVAAQPGGQPAGLRDRGPQRQADVAGMRWLGVTALFCAAILIACGAILFVSANWELFTPGARFALVIALVAVFHIAGGMVRPSFRGLSIALHAVGTVSTGPAIMLVGEIFCVQYHWPNAVLLWTLGALAGWMLLRDQAQQILALLLVPVWIFCEIGVRTGNSIGDGVYMGRLCFVWGILYLTFFLGSRRKAVQGILFAAGAIAAVAGIELMTSFWASGSHAESFIPFGTRVWAWVAIAALPLAVAAFHGHKGLIPIAAAIGFAITLPWCYFTWIDTYSYKNGPMIAHVETRPNLLAHALAAAFAVFLCSWGVRLASRALVNLGIVGFAAAVVWFYFSDIYSDKNRAVGLIGLGVLFLAGGWALEIGRRRILAGMKTAKPSPLQAAAGHDATRGADGGAQ
jgi:uncharacterized membrane protein